MSALTIMPEADALKAKGIHKQKFGSATKNIVCGDKLCSDVKHDGEANQQSRFQVGDVAQQAAKVKSPTQSTGTSPATSLSVLDRSISEGASSQNSIITIPVSISGTIPSRGIALTITVTDQTAVSTGSAADYSKLSSQQSSVTIRSGSSYDIPITIIGDSTYEQNETFSVTISTSTANVSVTKPSAQITIVNDDADPSTTSPTSVPTISIADLTQNEGNGYNNFMFTVTLSAPSATDTTFRVGTSKGTATSGTMTPADYNGNILSTYVIRAGATSYSLGVQIIGDTIPESDETFTVTLLSPVGATIDDGTATGTITNDDGTTIDPTSVPTISIADVTQNEGNTFADSIFTVTLSAPSATDTTFVVTASPGTATTQGFDTTGDYFLSASPSYTIPAGYTTYSLRVTIIGDTIPESDETFTVTLSSPVGATILDGSAIGTIINDD